MELAFLVYLLGTVLPTLSGIGVVLIVITALITMAWIIGGPVWLDSYYKDKRDSFYKGTKSYLKWAVPVMVVCSLIPSKEVSYTMVAAYTAQSVGQNDKVKDIAGQSLEVIEMFLEKTRAELTKDTVEK